MDVIISNYLTKIDKDGLNAPAGWIKEKSEKKTIMAKDHQLGKMRHGPNGPHYQQLLPDVQYGVALLLHSY